MRPVLDLIVRLVMTRIGRGVQGRKVGKMMSPFISRNIFVRESELIEEETASHNEIRGY
jgi:hypothetical protein